MNKTVALIEVMNELLAHELWAIQRYTMYAEVCKDQEDLFLHSISTHRSLQGMEHAERLIEEIVFLEGEPQVTAFVPPPVPANAKDIRKLLCPVEQKAVETYRRSIQLAGETGEESTRDILETLLEKEREHLDWLQKKEPSAPSADGPVSTPSARGESSPS